MRQNASSASCATPQPASSISDFTHAAYRQLLLSLQRTHAVGTLEQYARATGAGPGVILRHDIDYSLPDALALAELEAGLGISATYFLLFSAPTYNLLAPENIGAARQLRALGHEVGLHYDVSAILRAGGDPPQVLDTQARLLGELAGAPVLSIAMHNPSINGADLFRSAPYINAYDDRYCQAIAYYSDSCMAWRNAFIAAYRGGLRGDLQLLIHPCLWTARRLTRRQKLERIYSAVNASLRDEQARSQAIWSNHAGAREHDTREGAALRVLSQFDAS